MTEVIEAFVGAEKISSNIIVVGVGGAGCNAAEGMYNLGIHNVMFMVCNTDSLALHQKPIPLKISLGASLTKGLGAGADPNVGREAALESENEIRSALIESKSRMAFITAGMGGGTGTGAAPVIARIAQELDILTVGIVSIPQASEGSHRKQTAMEGLKALVKHLDSLLIIDNQSIVESYGDLRATAANAKANDILARSAKGIAEIVTIPLTVNVDFADVKTTMKKSGIALVGSAIVKISNQEHFVDTVLEEILHSSLLMKNDIVGAKKILLNISWGGEEPLSRDMDTIMKSIQNAAGANYQASLILGHGFEEGLEKDELKITLVATAFATNKNDVFGLYDTESDDDAKNTDAKSIKLDYRGKIKDSNIDYLKQMSFDQVEEKPAYSRYGMNVAHTPDKKNKVVVKLED